MSNNRSVGGLRDENKAKRRDAILDALISLLNSEQSADVTNEEIATLAGVAPATVYNLLGTRGDLMVAAMNRELDKLAESMAERRGQDPVEMAVRNLELAVDSFTANSAAFRRIIPIARRVATPETISHDPSSFQAEAMRLAQQAGVIRDDVDAGGLGRQIHLSYTGAITLWSTGRLDDEGLSIAVKHGLYTALAAAATEQYQPKFARQFMLLSKELEHSAWGRKQEALLDQH
jgi:AcrR family transcriptional regulator